MKKVLTVLLVIAVMFTFSFGSAFAANEVPGDTKTHAEAMTQAEKEIVDDFNKNISLAKDALADEYTEVRIDADCTIAGSVYARTLDQMAKDFADVVEVAAKQVDAAKATETSVAVLKNEISKVTDIDIKLVYDNTAIKVTVNKYPTTVDALKTYVTESYPTDTLQTYYLLYTWNNAVGDMKSYLNGEIAKIDMSLYTDDVADEDDPFEKTWTQLAQEAKDDLLDVVSDAEISMAMKIGAAGTELIKMYDVLDALEAYDTVTTVTGKKLVNSYKLADPDIKTKEDLADSDATKAADKAKLLAVVQANAAEAYKAALATYNAADKSTSAKKKAAQEALDAAKEKIDAYTDVNTLLIEKEKITTEADLKCGNAPLSSDVLVKRIDTYEDVVEKATAYKLQVEKDGSLKYIASVIDENLEDVQVKIYNNELWSLSDLLEDAENEPSNLAWEKEVAIAALEDEMDGKLYDDDGCDNYYAPEKADVEAAYQKVIDKVNATTTSDQLKKLNKTVSLTGINDKATVNTKVKGYLNTTKFVDAVNNYVDYLNINLATYDDGYRAKLTDADKDDVAKFLAKNGARTNADVADLLSKAEEYARAIATNAETKAEKAAVDELAKALPSVITLADKAAVKAAWEAADAAAYYPTKITNAVELVKKAESDAIDDMLDALPKTITVADKAAVNAILDAIDVYCDEAMYVNGHTAATYAKQDKADKAFEDLRAAEKAAVEATIAALPADATTAQVEAAIAAVDAFVEEYTDAHAPDYHAIEKIENLDKLTFLEAQVKANQIAAVEGLKITTKSTAKKGSITVKWTVKGDASDIDGYQVWKSTKKNSGFGKKPLFKTTKQSYKNTKGLTKGTRYYYKVRAYKVIDGVTYYSDYSNKAYRVAK